MQSRKCLDTIVFLVTVWLVVSASAQSAKEPRFLSVGDDGRLVYGADQRGNRIPDFSHCGYMGGNTPIPNAPVKVVVSPMEGDNTKRI